LQRLLRVRGVVLEVKELAKIQPQHPHAEEAAQQPSRRIRF
jgi:hypothetical protein